MTELRTGADRILIGCEAVLFDKDGTLVDIHHYWASMIRLRSALLVELWTGDEDDAVLLERLVGAMGVDGATGRMKPEGPVGVLPRATIVRVATDELRAGGVEVEEVDVEEAFAEVDRRTAGELAPLVRLLPGVSDLLDRLASRGVATAVVTTDLSERARRALEVVGLLDRFAVVVGGDDVARTKPAPDLACSALTALGVDASASVVVGDHPVDVGMAMAAGCGASVGVLTGLADEGDFAGEPCTTVPDLTHLSVT